MDYYCLFKWISDFQDILIIRNNNHWVNIRLLLHIDEKLLLKWGLSHLNQVALHRKVKIRLISNSILIHNDSIHRVEDNKCTLRLIHLRTEELDSCVVVKYGHMGVYSLGIYTLGTHWSKSKDHFIIKDLDDMILIRWEP